MKIELLLYYNVFCFVLNNDFYLPRPGYTRRYCFRGVTVGLSVSPGCSENEADVTQFALLCHDSSEFPERLCLL